MHINIKCCCDITPSSPLYQVYYRQLCRKCQVGLNPYKVESVLCKVCLLFLSSSCRQLYNP